MLLYKFLASTIQEKNISKISASTWNGKLKMSNALYYVSDIEDRFEEVIKKHER